jgi:hypothetical protein
VEKNGTSVLEGDSLQSRWHFWTSIEGNVMRKDLGIHRFLLAGEF